MSSLRNSLVYHNDLEGCYQKYIDACDRWRDYWWEGVVIIFQKSNKWLAMYVLDTKNKKLLHISAHKTIKIPRAVKGNSYVYITRLIDKYGHYKQLKAGKANSINERFSQILYTYYESGNYTVDNLELIHYWALPSEQLAYSFENLVHNYLSKHYRHYRNDRYDPVELTTEDFIELNNLYQVFINNFC